MNYHFKKLEKTQISVDPYGMFDYWDCAGYDNKNKRNESIQQNQ